jgi:hypothetical protein
MGISFGTALFGAGCIVRVFENIVSFDKLTDNVGSSDTSVFSSEVREGASNSGW